jgi:hypothetical protein
MAKGRILPICLAFVAAIACAREEVPPELIGRWTTNDPRYADRTLEISAERVVFGVGPGGRLLYAARGVERDTDAGGELYRLYYDLPGEPELTLELRIPQPGQLVIQNRSQLWTRAGAPTAGG